MWRHRSSASSSYMHMCVYMCVQLGGTYENEDVKRRLYVCVSWVIRLVGTYNPKLHCHIVKKFEFELHTKFLTVHACKKAVCDWCQSADTFSQRCGMLNTVESPWYCNLALIRCSDNHNQPTRQINIHAASWNLEPLSMNHIWEMWRVDVHIQVPLTFAVTIDFQLLKLGAVGNAPGKAGVPFRREGQVQLAHIVHWPRMRACLKITKEPLWREGRDNMTHCTQGSATQTPPATGEELTMGSQWSLTTCNLSCLKVGMSNNSCTDSMEDSFSFKSRSSTATSAAVRCWASNGHTVQWSGQNEKNRRS